jgi:hypothetical protein
MSTEIQKQQTALIGISENKEIKIRLEEHTLRINQKPDEKILQFTPDRKAQYIPIAIIENQLREDYYGLVQFELLTERRELNEIIVTARIKVFHPVINQWLNYDGIGAVQIMQSRVDTGEKDHYGKPITRSAELVEFDQTKQKNALQLNAPKAYAEAIKNAAKKIGVKYGANINRNFEEDYEPETIIQNAMEEVGLQIERCACIEELLLLWESYPEMQSKGDFKVMFNAKKRELKNGLTQTI